MGKLYTKTGDKGETSLHGGERCNKSNPRVEAYGTVDEVSSAIAVAIAGTKNPANSAGRQELKIGNELRRVQRDLFHLGALLAGESKDKKKRLKFLRERVSEIEKEIDRIQEKLPVQRQFYLPGGSKTAAWLDFARAVARRAERRIAALPYIDKEILQYINRLSDYLYAIARLINFKQKVQEKIWTGELKVT